MSSPQIERLTELHGLPVVDCESVEAFASGCEHSVLFFGGSPVKYAETNDVAMALPELLKAFDGGLQAALVALADEPALQRRYGFTKLPSLVFLRRGELLGVISGIQNWDDYLTQIKTLLAGKTQPLPIPVVQLVD